MLLCGASPGKSRRETSRSPFVGSIRICYDQEFYDYNVQQLRIQIIMHAYLGQLKTLLCLCLTAVLGYMALAFSNIASAHSRQTNLPR